MLFHSPGNLFVPPTDDLTIPQAFIDARLDHHTRPNKVGEWPCLIEEHTGRKIFREELQDRTNKLAVRLKLKYGLKRGDTISLFAPNHVDYGVAIWAGHRLGCTIAPTPPAVTPDELSYLIQLVHPTLLITHTSNLSTAFRITFPRDRIITIDADTPTSVPSIPSLLASHPWISKEGEECVPLARQEVDITLQKGEAKTLMAFLCFSSGTTGKPKAVAISHYNVISNVIQVMTHNRNHEDYTSWEEQRFRVGDVCTGVLPLYHIYGLVVNFHYLIYAKLTIVICQKFDFTQMLQSIARYKITHLMIVPPMAVLFSKHPASEKADLSSVRYCMIAGAPVTAELTEQLMGRLKGVQLGQGYGMTETSPTLAMWPTSQPVGTFGSAGHTMPGTVSKIVKPDGTLGGYEEEGELWVTGPQVALGYYENEAATKEVYVDGWVRTGDIGLFQRNEDLFIVDRIKELIKVKGFQVAPAELEGHLLGHPDVADAGVIGIPDAYAGEVPLAFVVLKERWASLVKAEPRGAKAEELRKSVFQHVAKEKSQYKWLNGGIEFVNALPKSPSGKILRRVLREQASTIKNPAKAKL